jgi:hypothetical protein
MGVIRQPEYTDPEEISDWVLFGMESEFVE